MRFSDKYVNRYFKAHAAIAHCLLKYVRADVHTNAIEAFWAVLKRPIGGAYRHGNPRHLGRHLAEQIYRFNQRENKERPRFAKATQGANEKRLTYKTLRPKHDR